MCKRERFHRLLVNHCSKNASKLPSYWTAGASYRDNARTQIALTHGASDEACSPTLPKSATVTLEQFPFSVRQTAFTMFVNLLQDFFGFIGFLHLFPRLAIGIMQFQLRASARPSCISPKRLRSKIPIEVKISDGEGNSNKMDIECGSRRSHTKQIACNHHKP